MTIKRLFPYESSREPIRDLATERGNYILEAVAIGDYLACLGLFDPDTRDVRFDQSMAATFQRAALDIRQNPIKQRMFRDLCRGCSLPPLVVHQGSDQPRLFEIIDGLQRTHVLTEVLRALLTLEAGGQLEDYAQAQIEALNQRNQNVLKANEFLGRAVVLQVWRDLQHDELVRLFMVLNAGQQKVSPRHLLEVIHGKLRTLFETWGMRLLTEKEENLIPKRRGRKPPEAMAIPSAIHFRYEFLIDGVVSYVSHDPQIKTRRVLEDHGGIDDRLGERIIEIGEELCKADLQWACLKLNRLINRRYADTPKWRSIIQASDNFFIPLMSALGEAREKVQPASILDQRKNEILAIITNSWHDDPLRFYTGGANSLERVLDDVKSNIGRRRREIVHVAWQSFFIDGIFEADFPINWRGAMTAGKK